METRYRSSADRAWVMAYFEGEEADVVLRAFELRLPISEFYRDTDGL